MPKRDGYTGFGFYQAKQPLAATVVATAGDTIDLLDFNTATMLVNVGVINFQSASALHLALQHGLASAAGVSAWSFVPGSQLIHSVNGGYDSTAETGIWHSFLSTEMGSDVYAVGYKGDTAHRYLRLYISGDGGLGSMVCGAVAVLGEPTFWSVNSPVNT